MCRCAWSWSCAGAHSDQKRRGRRIKTETETRQDRCRLLPLFESLLDIIIILHHLPPPPCLFVSETVLRLDSELSAAFKPINLSATRQTACGSVCALCKSRSVRRFYVWTAQMSLHSTHGADPHSGISIHAWGIQPRTCCSRLVRPRLSDHVRARRLSTGDIIKRPLAAERAAALHKFQMTPSRPVSFTHRCI